jgi:O-acetyl-ADP-ribose deacetylase (regulator of RNase III)
VEYAHSIRVSKPAGPPASIELVRGDITTIRVDAIVNAANEYLAGGGGVDGAIHDAAGPEIDDELRARYRGCPTGSAVITGAGRLEAHGVKWIVHAVGPIWRGGGGGEPELLRSAYEKSMHLADQAGSQSVAFPAISAGVYGYPLDAAASIALSAVRDGLAGAHRLERAVFVLFGPDTFRAFERALRDLAAKA